MTAYPKRGREHFIVDYGTWREFDFTRYSDGSNLDIEFDVKMESDLPSSVRIDEKRNDFAEQHGCECCGYDLSHLLRDLPFESIMNKVEGKPYLFGDWTSQPSDFKPKRDE
jgi:hypothetical protein